MPSFDSSIKAYCKKPDNPQIGDVYLDITHDTLYVYSGDTYTIPWYNNGDGMSRKKRELDRTI